MSTTVVTLLWVFGGLVVGALGKWIAWSAKQGVRQVIEPLANDLREHMTEEAARAAVNDEQHADFRRRITRLENAR